MSMTIGAVAAGRRRTLPTLTNTAAPSISGLAHTGQVLTSGNGTWSATPDSYPTRQWKRDGAAISGETGTTYTVKSADEGHTLTVTVTAAKAGYANGSATSAGAAASAPAAFVLDSFTDTAGTSLVSHTGETGATWTKHNEASTGVTAITAGGRIRQNSANLARWYASGVPASPDYWVDAIFYFASIPSGATASVTVRASISAATYYSLRYQQSSGQWQIVKLLAGAGTVLGTYAASPAAGSSSSVRLRVTGGSTPTLVATIDGVDRITATDTTSPITAAGRLGFEMSGPTATDSTGIQIEIIDGMQ